MIELIKEGVNKEEIKDSNSYTVFLLFLGVNIRDLKWCPLLLPGAI
jgi:hypothetical protein